MRSFPWTYWNKTSPETRRALYFFWTITSAHPHAARRPCLRVAHRGAAWTEPDAAIPFQRHNRVVLPRHRRRSAALAGSSRRRSESTSSSVRRSPESKRRWEALAPSATRPASDVVTSERPCRASGASPASSVCIARHEGEAPRPHCTSYASRRPVRRYDGGGRRGRWGSDDSGASTRSAIAQGLGPRPGKRT